MRVVAGRRRHIRVTQTLLYHLGVDARLNQRRRVGMAHSMELDVGKIMAGSKAFPFLCERIRVIKVNELLSHELPHEEPARPLQKKKPSHKAAKEEQSRQAS